MRVLDRQSVSPVRRTKKTEGWVPGAYAKEIPLVQCRHRWEELLNLPYGSRAVLPQGAVSGAREGVDREARKQCRRVPGIFD